MHVQHDYLMESEGEASRLFSKGDERSTREQLLATGFDKLQAGAHIVDAGAGVGFVSHIMGELIRATDPASQLTLIDGSAERLNHASDYLRSQRHYRKTFLTAELGAIPLPDDQSDYTFSRFVLEYCPDPEAIFEELLRITKPGGKLVIGDLDYNCLTHYPIEPELERQMYEITHALQRMNLFDPYVGRKLYSYYHDAGLADIRIHFRSHHLFYGDLHDSDYHNWNAKLDQMVQMQHAGSLDLTFDCAEFRTRFMAFLKSPGRFTYTPLILVEGVKPA